MQHYDTSNRRRYIHPHFAQFYAALFLGSNNLETKQIFASSMGKKTGISTSYNKGNNGDTSESVTTADVPVVRISDLDSLKLGEFYIRSRQLGNVKSFIVPFFRRADINVSASVKEQPYRMFDPKANAYWIKDTLAQENQNNRRSKFNFDF